MRWGHALVVALSVLGTTALVRAQETGGSFESDDWGSSSDYGSSSGSSDYGSSGSSDYGSSDYGSSDYGSSDYGSSGSSDYGSSYPSTDYDTSSSTSHGANEDLQILLVLLVFAAIIGIPVFFVLLSNRMRGGSPSLYAFGSDRIPVVGPRHVPGLVDVSMLQLAIDWRARKFVQATLARLAQGTDSQSKEGRARMLAAVVEALRSVRLAWIYAGARNYQPMVQNAAQQEFKRITADVRASFRQEVVRAAGGRVVSVEAIGVQAREHEGPGVVLVSVIVAARREIFDVDATRAASIDRLLASLASLRADEVIALSVVWTPAAEEDRMSTDELAQRNRHLVRIGDIGGRVFCSFCAGPFAAELATCPHCGAPSKDALPAAP